MANPDENLEQKIKENFVNAENARLVAEAKEEEDRKRRKIVADTRIVLKSVAGRRHIWEQLARSGIFSASFGADDRSTNFREGQRDIGIQLLRDVNEADPKAYAQMQEEYIAAQIQQSLERDKKENQDD